VGAQNGTVVKFGHFQQNEIILSPFDLAIVLFGENFVLKKLCTQIFVKALSIIAKTWQMGK
jgi:hypothetical protein